MTFKLLPFRKIDQQARQDAPPRLTRAKALLAAAFSTATLSIAPVAAAQSQGADPYVPAYDYFDGIAGRPLLGDLGYQGAVWALEDEFDTICGDTFCEGEYGNLKSLDLDCSVTQVSGQVGQCTWTFAGSYTETDPATGHLTVSAKTFVCDLGVKGTAKDLADFLLAAAQKGAGGTLGLHSVAIPGSGRTLMDTLVDCF
jgi:hypothetical protein